MKIGLITTWNQACGIASYSKFLVKSLQKAGHEVKGLAKTAPHLTELVEPDESFVLRVKELEPQIVRQYFADCNLVHVQYQNFLFGNVRSCLCFDEIPVVMTFHDSCIRMEDVYYDGFIVHNSKFANFFNQEGKLGRVIYPGVPIIDEIELTYPERLVSFGLGRNMDDVVKNAIKDLPKIEFMTSYGHHKWLNFDELSNLLASSGAIILFYPSTDALVASLSAKIAIGMKRPVIVSETNWFQELPDVVFRARENNLAEVIKDVYDNYVFSTNNNLYSEWKRKVDLFVKENSWDMTAHFHLQFYEKLIENKKNGNVVSVNF